MSDDDELFAVETILEKRENPERFYVKWKGYSTSHNSWEPRSSLEMCLHFIEDFERDQKVRFYPGRGTFSRNNSFSLLGGLTASFLSVLHSTYV